MIYTAKNTTLKYQNSVELWLLDSNEVLIAFYNLKSGTVEINRSEIYPLRAANLILFHMWSELSLDRQRDLRSFHELEDIIEASILNNGEA